MSEVHLFSIQTPRLALSPISGRLAGLIIEGDWSAVSVHLGVEFPSEWRCDGWAWLEDQATRADHDPRFITWGTRLARPACEGAAPGPVLAEVGFHGPPDREGVVEIGYRVVRDHRRRGLALEAAAALLSFAADQGANAVRAAIAPENTASIGLARKLGFVADGIQQHALLGPQLRFVRPITS